MEKEFFRRIKIPLLPLSAIVFYFIVIILVKFGFIPPPENLIVLLENLYDKYGLISLFIASLLEGVVYLGLYFAGSSIIIFVVLFSNGKFLSLLNISLVVAFALTLASLINYSLGRHISLKPSKQEKILEKQVEEIEKKENKRISKSFLLSAIHPNFLAFYFFNLGLEKKEFWKIIFVPLIMVPYGFMLAFLTTSLKSTAKSSVESPYILITLLFIWFVIAFIFKNNKKLNLE